MIKAAHYLKPAWARRQLELALPLLPAATGAALWLGDKKLADMNADNLDMSAANPAVQRYPLTLEQEEVGCLLLLPPTGEGERAARAGSCLLHGLQGMLDIEHARRAVAQETLESYREMALLQRAVANLNHSLKPAIVAAALLKEFDGRKDAADHGAVFLRPAGGDAMQLVESFGDGAAKKFTRLERSGMLAEIARREMGDIANDLATTPWAAHAPDFRSLLWLPLVAHGKHLGMLLLASTHVDGFAASDMKRAQTLASVAAAALHNAQLYAAEQNMFRSFVRVVAAAIDAKSPYTAGHCRRVPKIALMIAEAAHAADSGPFADFVLDEDERNAIEIAAMLHDCGKVITPEWIVDKANKLDAIVNRLDWVAARFEVLRRDALIERYRVLAAGEDAATAERAYQERLRQLDDDFAFLKSCNTGGEFVSDEHIDRINAIAGIIWRGPGGDELPLLTEDEIYNLTTRRGTLNPKERKIIEDHAAHTIAALSQIAFPHSLRNVTEYAGGHHERMDGTGYPRGLKQEQLSIPARIIAIADIFEALTAPDRPYRKAGTLDWAIDIMRRMKQDRHIDGDLFDLFLASGVHSAYARKHLNGAAPNAVDPALRQS